MFNQMCFVCVCVLLTCVCGSCIRLVTRLLTGGESRLEDALRALQQQVNALQSQNAALGTQLRSHTNIAESLAELPGKATSVLWQRRRLLRAGQDS